MDARASTAEGLSLCGLVHVSPFGPGFRRVPAPGGVQYFDADGRRISDVDTLERIRRLAIPPAWRDVWIAPDPLAHIQATGFDKAGRKQYRYHPAWRDLRDDAKFQEVTTFGERLPAVRKRVETDLSTEGLGHARVLGCAVRLLDLGSFRIGCERYAVQDDTHGLTTMLSRDVRLEGDQVIFDYVGKAHKHQVQHVVDAEARGVVSRLLSSRAPEQPLFAFRSGDHWVGLHAGDVNNYLKEASGMSSSAKEFRTWNATVLGAAALAGSEPPHSGRAATRAMTSATKVVAQYLGNTPAIARHSYVDPRVFDTYRQGWIILPRLAELGIGLEARPPSARRPVEVAVLDLIRQQWDSHNLRNVAVRTS
jgi:DNA topoisomerase IB